MRTLGINAAFHDSAACLIEDGNLRSAAEEERFTRIKHAKRPIPFSAYELPFHAISFCLQNAGISLNDIDHVAYSFDPELFPSKTNRRGLLTLPIEPSAAAGPSEDRSPWDPLFLASIINAPRHLHSGYPHHLQAVFRGGFADSFRWHFVPHHLAHAVSAFLPSPFEEAAVLCLDGRGESATTSYWKGVGNRLIQLGQVEVPHSLGLLYERITSHLGFLHSSDEYKVMALASYGAPRFLRQFRDAIVLGENGRYLTQIEALLERLPGPRKRGDKLQQDHFDIAASLQTALEETVLDLSKWLREAAASENLCMAGGVALNCVMNGMLREKSPFQNIWVQPAASDAGTALGAALYVDAKERGESGRSWRMEHAFLGPQFSDTQIETFLREAKLDFERPAAFVQRVAEILAQGEVVGWFQGAEEFGPRALGGRSLLASPLKSEMLQHLNRIKGRERFRPVAPVIPEQLLSEWFETDCPSPFMLFTARVRPERERQIPAVVHVDKTARVQTVAPQQNPLLFQLLEAFHDLTGVPVLINTSFNTGGKPIVSTPEQAVECFSSAAIDALAIGPYLLLKGARRIEPALSPDQHVHW